MSKGKFYITTPIYYPSDKLHIGHTYCTVATDAIARYKRMCGYDVMFLTGTDEHGQKIEEKAEAAGVTPKQFVDNIVEGPGGVRALWKLMNISNDRFIRTTDDYHVEAVQRIFKKMYDKGDIYKGKYSGMYCTPCESFWTESQLVDGKCPDCGREVHYAEEEAYFFRLSKYAEPVRELLLSGTFLEPASRVNEMIKNFIDPGLEDLCVSRTSFTWGIPVDFDPGHVVYVWVDALFNYCTALGFLNDKYDDYEKFWPADVHMVGKEIVRFHSIIWPAMLMSMGMPLPKHVYGHGWLVMDGGKMSKSKGNVVRPQEVSEKFGAEILRLWVASTDYSGELRLGQTILKRVVESYRRVRNTLRFLLANTSDFDASKDLVPVENLLELDRWALAYTERFQKEVLAEYGEFRFHNVVSMLQTFASADLGSFYLDVLKDRLYTTAPGSEARRSAQTALWYITKTLLRLMAPVLSFTAEEAFKVFSPNESETIFTERFEPLPEVAGAEGLLAKWDAVRTVRADLQKKIEELRGEGQIGSSLQAVVRIEAAPAVYDALASLGDELRFVMIVSAVELVKSADEETHFAVSASKEGKCERCWHYVAGIGSDAEHPTLCPRCASNLFGAGEKRLFA